MILINKIRISKPICHSESEIDIIGIEQCEHDHRRERGIASLNVCMAGLHILRGGILTE